MPPCRTPGGNSSIVFGDDNDDEKKVYVRREVVGVSEKLLKTATSESAPKLEDPSPRSDVPRSTIKVQQPPGGKSQVSLG